jgi:hypothetical protein
VDYLICPCCGTEFGYDDFAMTYQEHEASLDRLRERWLARGMPWTSRVTPHPPGWNAVEQFFAAGFGQSYLIENAETESELRVANATELEAVADA